MGNDGQLTGNLYGSYALYAAGLKTHLAAFNATRYLTVALNVAAKLQAHNSHYTTLHQLLTNISRYWKVRTHTHSNSFDTDLENRAKLIRQLCLPLIGKATLKSMTIKCETSEIEALLSGKTEVSEIPTVNYTTDQLDNFNNIIQANKLSEWLRQACTASQVTVDSLKGTISQKLYDLFKNICLDELLEKLNSTVIPEALKTNDDDLKVLITAVNNYLVSRSVNRHTKHADDILYDRSIYIAELCEAVKIGNIEQIIELLAEDNIRPFKGFFSHKFYDTLVKQRNQLQSHQTRAYPNPLYGAGQA